MDTLAIVQYLDSLGKRIQPVHCIERNYPTWVADLPSIEIVHGGHKFVGLDACCTFYENVSGVSNLLGKAMTFKLENAEYRIQKS